MVGSISKEEILSSAKESIAEIQQQNPGAEKDEKIVEFRRKVLSWLLVLSKEERAKVCEEIRVIMTDKQWSPDKETFGIHHISSIAEFIQENKNHDSDFSELLKGIKGHTNLQQISSTVASKAKLSRESKTLLALLYRTGIGQSVNYSLAIEHFEEAAQQGHSRAQYGFGVMYYYGHGVNKDYKKAAEWFKEAAEQDNAAGQYALGIMYANGYSVPNDHNEAIRWYKKAAEQGHASAQCELGRRYMSRSEKDLENASKMCARAIERGDTSNATHLNRVYFDSKKRAEKDFGKAIKLFQKAAQQSCAPAQFYLGCMYDNGYGVARNYKEAVKWYIRAAKQGHLTAQCNLGVMYINGYGVTRNKVKAITLWKKAAKQGVAAAQHYLGVTYYLEGNAERKRNIAERKYREAAKFFEQAVQQEYADAQSYLGEMYSKGRGVDGDNEKAVEWYEKAAQQNNFEGISKLVEISINMIQQQESDPKKMTVAFKQKLLWWSLMFSEEGKKKVWAEIKELIVKNDQSPKEKKKTIYAEIKKLMRRTPQCWPLQTSIFELDDVQKEAQRIRLYMKRYDISAKQAIVWSKSKEQLLPFLLYSKEKESKGKETEVPDYFNMLPIEVWLFYIFPRVIGLNDTNCTDLIEKLTAKKKQLRSLDRNIRAREIRRQQKNKVREKINLAIFGKVKLNLKFNELEREKPDKQADSYLKMVHKGESSVFASLFKVKNIFLSNSIENDNERALALARVANNPGATLQLIKDTLLKVLQCSSKGPHSLWHYLSLQGLYRKLNETSCEQKLHKPATR